MKLVWFVLALILFVVIMRPPADQRNSQAEPLPPFHPNAVAKSLTAAPGAIVCPDLATVGLVFKLYAAHWEDSSVDAMTNGQSRLLREPMPAPNVKAYGCSLLTPGTPVHVEQGVEIASGVAIVSARLPDGTMVSGVTLPSMLSKLNS